MEMQLSELASDPRAWAAVLGVGAIFAGLAIMPHRRLAFFLGGLLTMFAVGGGLYSYWGPGETLPRSPQEALRRAQEAATGLDEHNRRLLETLQGVEKKVEEQNPH